jgi:hypothetical protein
MASRYKDSGLRGWLWGFFRVVLCVNKGAMDEKRASLPYFVQHNLTSTPIANQPLDGIRSGCGTLFKPDSMVRMGTVGLVSLEMRQDSSHNGGSPANQRSTQSACACVAGVLLLLTSASFVDFALLLRRPRRVSISIFLSLTEHLSIPDCTLMLTFTSVGSRWDANTLTDDVLYPSSGVGNFKGYITFAKAGPNTRGSQVRRSTHVNAQMCIRCACVSVQLDWVHSLDECGFYRMARLFRDAGD